MSAEIDRENPLLVGAIVYRLMGESGKVTMGNYGQFCDALDETYNLQTEDVYHIACDIEDYYEQDLRR